MGRYFLVFAVMTIAVWAAAQTAPLKVPSGPVNGGMANGMPGSMVVTVEPSTMEQMLETRKEVELPKDLEDIEGTVTLQAMIDETGHVMNLKAISGNAMLYQPVLQAVQQWSYRPFLMNGRPVKVSTRIIVQIKKQ